MAGPLSAQNGFAYLFEKFPSFSQTFCAREVKAMRELGLEFPVFSIRKPADEPHQDVLAGGEVRYLPEKYDDLIANDADFRRACRKGQEELCAEWGCEKEKRRIYEALWLGPQLKQAGIKHLHIHFAGTGARTAYWIKRFFGVDFSITAHANDIFRDEPPERLAKIFEAARLVVTVSDFSVRFLQENYPAQSEKFVRVYNGIEMERFRQTDFAWPKPLILSVGRYIEKKGFHDLVAACESLGERDFECHIVGLGPLEESLKEAVIRRGLQGRVFISGPKTEGEIGELLSHAQVFALPCLNAADGAVDNLPTVIMEAMAAGVPVVSTAVAGIPEMVIDEVSGFVVAEKDPVAFAKNMARLIDDQEQARAMGEAGQARCQELFETKRTSAALLKVLKAHGAITNAPADR